MGTATIDQLPLAGSLSLADELELDQFVTETQSRQSVKATLEQLQALFSGLGQPVVKIDDTDSPYTATESEPIILVDTSAGPVTINLPEIVVGSTGFQIKLLPTNAVNQVTLVPGAGDTIEYSIDAVDYYLVSSGQAVELIPYVIDNNWNVF